MMSTWPNKAYPPRHCSC